MLALGFALLLLAAAAYMAGSGRRFHVAPILWCAAWGMMLLLYRLIGSGYEYLRWVIWFTIAAVLAWLVGHFAVAGVAGRVGAGDAQRPRRTYQLRYLRSVMAACFVIGLIAPIHWVSTANIAVSRITSVGALGDVVQGTYQMLYEQRVEEDGITKATLMVALAGVIVAGLYIGLGRPVDRSVPPKPVAPGEVPKPLKPTPYWLLLAPILPYLAMMGLTTLRTMMVVPLLMLLGSWVAGRYLVGRERAVFRAGSLARIFACLAVAIVAVIYMQAVRDGDPGLKRLGDTIGVLRLWTAGYEPGLVAWMSREWNHDYAWGASTFRVVAGLFGAEDTKLIYGEGAIDIGGGTSNAMTALRFFVEDWGMGGAVAFALLFGVATGWLGEQMRRGRLALAPLYAVLLATVIFAPNSWFLNYGARVFAPLIAIAYLVLFGSLAGERAETATAQPGPRRRSRRRRPSLGTVSRTGGAGPEAN